MKHALAIIIIVLISIIGIVGFGSEPVDAQGGVWTSQFYSSPNFTNPIPAPNGTPSFNSLTLSWGTAAPVPGAPADNFSAVFQSTQNLAAGTYTFTLNADDQATLFINGVQVISITQPGSKTAQAQLPGGNVTLRVDYVEISADAFIQVSWTGSGITGGTGGLPPSGPTATATLTPVPSATALPYIPQGAVTGTVIKAYVLNVRNGPSIGSPKIGQVLRGQTYAIVGRNSNARWYLLELGGWQGWVFSYYIYVRGNEYNAPVVSGNTLLNLAGQQDYGVRAQALGGMRLRAEPNVASAQIGRIIWGSFVPVVGRTADGYWYQIIWWDTVGWVYSPYMQIVDGNINNVPVR